MKVLTESEKKILAEKYVPIFTQLLKQNKVPESVIPFTLAQIILESNWFSSNPFNLDNNPAGITWNDNYKKRPGASLGRKRPIKEGGNYVHFDNFDSAVKDYVRIISLQRSNNNFGRPIDSLDILDYSKRLKANGYHTSSENMYSNNLRSQIVRLYKWFDLTNLIKKKTFNIVSLILLSVGIFIIYKKLKK
jgi:flagellum-specific peptidoglycan hydrolase FlgJ